MYQTRPGRKSGGHLLARSFRRRKAPEFCGSPAWPARRWSAAHTRSAAVFRPDGAPTLDRTRFGTSQEHRRRCCANL